MFYLKGEYRSEEVAKQRIKGPVMLLSPSLINQSGTGIVLSQLLSAAHVRMQGRRGGGGRKASQPVSAVDCSSISTANLMTGGLRWGGSDGLLFYTTYAMLITIL